MSEPRASIILAEANGDVTTLRAALINSDATTRAAALGALARLRHLETNDLQAGLIDPQPAVRCRAIELSIDETEIDIAAFLDDADDLVVETAAWALGERGPTDSETIAKLRSVAQDHDVSICREAAVAALGAIGDPAGLSTILAAMSDRAPVRRRAVLALAPFDGDEVTTALRSALDDRDRQVRQAAEDLLGSEI